MKKLFWSILCLFITINSFSQTNFNAASVTMQNIQGGSLRVSRWNTISPTNPINGRDTVVLTEKAVINLIDTKIFTALSGLSTVSATGDYNDLSNKPNLNIYYDTTTSNARYLQSYTETDPLWSVSPSFGITGINISNWNTAYGWGDHAGLYPLLSGSYSNPSWINSLPFSKITGFNSASITGVLGYTPINPNGSASEYIKGDGTKIAFPTIPSAQLNSDWNSTSGVDQILNKPTIPAAQIPSDWSQASTTSPDYIKNKPTINVGTVTNIITGPGLTGGPITNTGTISLATSGVTAGDYIIVTVDQYGRVISARNSSTTAISSSARSLNTAYQISTTKLSEISISVKAVSTLSLTSGQSGSIILEKSANGTSGWVYVAEIFSSNTGTLVIGLNTANGNGGQLTTKLPIGYYWRASTTGTGTFTFLGGEETTY